MGRKRKSTAMAFKKVSITDIPKSVFIDVLLKLPTRSIIICKCVCKTWRKLISDPEFTRLHFAQADACSLIRAWGPTFASRILYLVENEDISGFDFEDGGRSKVNECSISMNISKFKIPLRIAEEVTNYHNGVKAMLKGEHITKRKGGTRRKLGTITKPCINIDPYNHKYKLVNSCNGLLCLSKPFSNKPLAICNPITGEFINLPKPLKDEGEQVSICCGFGFSPKSNQYKVLRIFQQHDIRLAEIHTLGTGTWKCVGRAPPSAEKMKVFPTYLKGALYWYYHNTASLDTIVSFDFDNCRFHSVSPPPSQRETYHSLGVLGGCLCVSNTHHDQIDVWVMEDCGAQKSWTKRVSINIDHTWPGGCYKPMKYLKNGGLLMFHDGINALIYYHQRNCTFKYLQLQEFNPEFEAINHIPSFISLKDILMRDDVEVLDVHPRCARCEPLGESPESIGLVLVDKDPDIQYVSDTGVRRSRVFPWWG